MPKVDELIIDVTIEQLYEYIEEDGSVVKQWCSGVVVALKTQNRVLMCIIKLSNTFRIHL